MSLLWGPYPTCVQAGAASSWMLSPCRLLHTVCSGPGREAVVDAVLLLMLFLSSSFFIFFCVNFWWTHSLIRCKKKPCRSLIFFYFIFFFSLTFSLSFISRCICCLLDSWPGCLAARRPELHQLWDSECEKMVSSPGPAELCYESSNLFLQRWWDVGYHEENALLLFWR